MRRTAWVWWTLGALGTAGLLAWAFAPPPLPVETARAERGVFEAAIEEDGRTRVRERYVVVAPLGGHLRRITVHEGDPVRAGEVLARIEPSAVPLLDVRARREQQARADAAAARLAQAQARVRLAEVGVDQALSAQRRTDALRAQGFVSPAAAEADQLALMASQRERQAARDGERVARHELAQARVPLEAAPAPAPAPHAQALRSPVDGQVLRVHREGEGAVAPGAVLLEVADTRRLEAVAELLTADATRVVPGLAAQVSAGGAAAVAGRVRRVEPGAFTKVSALGVEEQRVNVIVELASASVPPAWGDGWRVTVRILTRRVEDALRVPASAVFPWTGAWPAEDAGAAGVVDAVNGTPGIQGGQGVRMGVFVLEGGRARLRAVQVGDRDAGLAWIVGGLDEGARVIVYPPPEVADGLRVRERGSN